MGRSSPAKGHRLIPNGPVMIASQTLNSVVCHLNDKVVQNPSVHLRSGSERLAGPADVAQQQHNFGI